MRRLVHSVVTLGLLTQPLAAVAQLVPDSSVATVPYNMVPALGTPLLVLLAVILAGGAALFLRGNSGALAKVAIAGVLVAAVGAAYARIRIYTVEGDQCAVQTVVPFSSEFGGELLSHCSNRIQIIDIQTPCQDPFLPPSACGVGQVLSDGQMCSLPLCRA